MKKSLSKKVLAMFLAALMLVTAIPFASFAADDPLSDLKASINQYVTKMDGSVFTNMSAAYDAYITAQKYADAYEYGTLTDTQKLVDAKDKLDQEASLNNYADNGKMVKFNFRSADSLSFTYPHWDNADANDNTVAQQQSRNVLYAGNFSTQGDKSASGESTDIINGKECTDPGKDVFTNRVYYGETVLLYDGKKESRPTQLTNGQTVNRLINPRFPVMASVYEHQFLGYSDGVRGKQVWWYTIAPAKSDAVIQYDGFNSGVYNETQQSQNYQVTLDRTTSADTRWWSGSLVNNSHYAANYNNDSAFLSGESARRGDHDASSRNIYDGSNYAYFASTLEFFRDMPDTEYTTTEYLTWIFFGEQTGYNGFFGLRQQWLSWGITKPSSLSTNVINYVAIEKLFNKIQGSSFLINPDKYNENENTVKAYMSAVDSLTSIINGIDKASTYETNVAEAVAKINTDLTTINTAVTNAAAIKADGSGYADLRNAINTYKETYNAGNDLGTYTADSWSKFEVAFGLAQEHMTALPNTGYTGAANLASELNKHGKENKTPDDPNATGLVKQPPCNADKYTIARNALKTALKNENLSAAALDTVAEMLNGNLEFFDVENFSTVPATRQADLDAEADLLDEATAILQKLADDTSYNLTIAGIETLNADSIDDVEISKLVEETKSQLEREVEVLGVKYTGYAYDEVASELQTAITENMYHYSVKMYDADGSIYVLVNEDGNVYPYPLGGVEDGEEFYDELPEGLEIETYHYNTVLTLDSLYGYECHWSISAQPEKTDIANAPKYIGTGAQCTFVVHGDTKLYLSEVMDESDRWESRITFVNSTAGEILDFGYTFEETFDMSNASIPNRAFYNITGYTCDTEGVTIEDGVISGIPFGEDITVKVVYTPVTEKAKFNIRVLDSALNDLLNTEYSYGELVKLEGSDKVKSFRKVNYNSATGKYETEAYLATGSTYSFEACENIIIIEDVNEAPDAISVSVNNAPVETNGKAFFVGSYACVPEGCEVISAGVVLDVDNLYPENLSLAKVDRNKNVYNMACASLKEGQNQFVLVWTAADMLKASNYVAYVIYSDGSAINQIAYSEIKHAEL